MEKKTGKLDFTLMFSNVPSARPETIFGRLAKEDKDAMTQRLEAFRRELNENRI